MKCCTRCKEEKSVTEFHKKASRCKPCAIIIAREWAQAHPERRREIARQHVQRNKESFAEYQREWRTKINPEQAQFLNRRSSHIRRARVRGIEGSYTQVEWQELLQQFDYTCANPICGRKHDNSRWGKLTVDHVVPIVLGGSNTIDNIQPLCYHCNYTKHNKIVDYRKEFFNARSAA